LGRRNQGQNFGRKTESHHGGPGGDTMGTSKKNVERYGGGGTPCQWKNVTQVSQELEKRRTKRSWRGPEITEGRNTTGEKPRKKQFA